jgi:acyl carrier protein phosphodiesterase
MAADDWLGSYREFAVMEQVLRGISRRLTQPGELGQAMQELRLLYEPLSEDFRRFYPELQVFAQSQLTTSN